MRVLVVESSAEGREALRTMIADQGWPTAAAASATAALAIASWFRPTVVLLGLSGLAMDAATFATLVRFDRVDRVAILGFGPPETAQPPELDGLLVAPFEIGEIRRALERIT